MGIPSRTHAVPLLGRGADLALLMECVEAGEIAYVHGLPGIGKSALLDALAEQARARGANVIALDCRAVEPTERGFLRAAGGFEACAELRRREAATRR